MSPKVRGSTRATRSTDGSSMYLVLKDCGGELKQIRTEIHPGSSEQLFAITSKDSRFEPIPTKSRRNIARTLKPCGECSASKSRCEQIRDNPPLCIRCKSKNRTECPPHIPWAQRKAHPEQRQQADNHQPGPSTQPFSPPLPEQIIFTTLPSPRPMCYPAEAYSWRTGEQVAGQYVGGSMVQQAYSYAPTSSSEGFPYFPGVNSGAQELTYQQMDPQFCMNFPHDSSEAQAGMSTNDETPPARYQQPYGYGFC